MLSICRFLLATDTFNPYISGSVPPNVVEPMPPFTSKKVFFVGSIGSASTFKTLTTQCAKSSSNVNGIGNSRSKVFENSPIEKSEGAKASFAVPDTSALECPTISITCAISFSYYSCQRKQIPCNSSVIQSAPSYSPRSHHRQACYQDVLVYPHANSVTLSAPLNPPSQTHPQSYTPRPKAASPRFHRLPCRAPFAGRSRMPRV
jgi:hypothetical protein